MAKAITPYVLLYSAEGPKRILRQKLKGDNIHLVPFHRFGDAYVEKKDVRSKAARESADLPLEERGTMAIIHIRRFNTLLGFLHILDNRKLYIRQEEDLERWDAKTGRWLV